MALTISGATKCGHASGYQMAKSMVDSNVSFPIAHLSGWIAGIAKLIAEERGEMAAAELFYGMADEIAARVPPGSKPKRVTPRKEIP